MEDKELYRQKAEAKLDELKAELAKLKAKAAGAGADGQLKLNKEMDVLEVKLKEGKIRLAELADAGSDRWANMKSEMESHWDALQKRFDKARVEMSDGNASKDSATGAPSTPPPSARQTTPL